MPTIDTYTDAATESVSMQWVSGIVNHRSVHSFNLLVLPAFAGFVALHVEIEAGHI